VAAARAWAAARRLTIGRTATKEEWTKDRWIRMSTGLVASRFQGRDYRLTDVHGKFVKGILA
jgi:hypothetical protein